MNKAEMIASIAEKTGAKKTDVTKFEDVRQEVVLDALKAGDTVQLVGFETIKPVGRAARKGYNPLSKENIDIEAKVGVSVSAGSKMKEAVAGLNVKDYLKN